MNHALVLSLLVVVASEFGCARSTTTGQRPIDDGDSGSDDDFALLVSAIAEAQKERADRWTDVTVLPVPHTGDIDADSNFQFTVSPDDRWLVYFRKFDSQAEPDLDFRYGKLQVVDLIAEQRYSFDLRGSDVSGDMSRADASWAPDSSYCLLEPPFRGRESPNKHVSPLIDVRDQNAPRVVKAEVTWGNQPTVTAQGEKFNVPERFGCSDCFPHTHDRELISRHVEATHLRFYGSAGAENNGGEQAVSPDGTRIYFQKQREYAAGPKLDEVDICELNIVTKAERTLATHRGYGPSVERKRVSPDGRRLAYQVSTSPGGFAGTLGLHVLDIANGDSRLLASEAFYTMHWSTDSRRLYFYEHTSHRGLSVAEFSPRDSGTESSPPTR